MGKLSNSNVNANGETYTNANTSTQFYRGQVGTLQHMEMTVKRAIAKSWKPAALWSYMS